MDTVLVYQQLPECLLYSLRSPPATSNAKA
jgi:hypothetical protein